MRTICRTFGTFGLIFSLVFLGMICTALVARADQTGYERLVIFDSFGGNSNIQLTSRIPNVRPDSSSVWTHLTFNGDDWIVETGGDLEMAVESDLFDEDHKIAIDSGVSNGVVRADMTRGNSQRIGLTVRSDGSGDQNNIFVWHDGSALTLAKRINGSFSFVGSSSFTWSSGDTFSMEVRMNGCNIDVFVDNIARISSAQICDEELVDNTYHGLFSRDGSSSGGTFDNFAVYTNQPASEPTVINEAGTIQDTGVIAFLWAGLAVVCAAIGFRNQAGIFHIVAAIFVFLFMLQMDMMLVYLAGSGLMIFLLYSSGVLKR